MAFVGSPNPQQGFKPELTNVAMAHNIYQTAFEEQVGRVVVASKSRRVKARTRLERGR